ncbi:MAG TPA: EamA family transporter [Aggregatilineales bacterium]|nr:EamA family transporter [Anaerolineales bacterium]HRE46954.1 EamA family transporter [Aggregatilineales bacterium]
MQITGKRSPLNTGVLMVFVAALFFGTIPVFSTLLQREGVQVWLQVGVRLTLTVMLFGILLALFPRRFGAKGLLPSWRDARFAAFNGLMLLGSFVTYITALGLSTSNKVVLLAYLYPLFTAIIARVVLGEALTRLKLAALGIGFTGIAVTIQVWTIRDLRDLNAGDMLAILNGLLTALYVVTGRWWRTTTGVTAVPAVVWSAGSALLGLLGLGMADLMLNGGGGCTLSLPLKQVPQSLFYSLAWRFWGRQSPTGHFTLGLGACHRGSPVCSCCQR